MENSITSNPDDSDSSSVFFSIMTKHNPLLAEYSMPVPDQVMLPYSKDRKRQRLISLITLSYLQIYDAALDYIVCIKKQLCPANPWPYIAPFLSIERNIASLVRSLDFYEKNPDLWGKDMFGYEIFEEKNDKEVVYESCYRELVDIQEKVVKQIKEIGNIITHRDEKDHERLFVERLEDYCLQYKMDAVIEFQRLRREHPELEAETIFLKKAHDFKVVQLYKRHHGSIGSFFKKYQRRYFQEEAIEYLLEYVMRKQIIENSGSGEQDLKTKSLSIASNLPPFAQYVIDPTDATQTLLFMHMKIDVATKPDPILSVVAALCEDSILYDNIPYEDFIEEFKVSKLVSQSVYSKKKGSSASCSEKIRGRILDAYYRFIKANN